MKLHDVPGHSRGAKASQKPAARPERRYGDLWTHFHGLKRQIPEPIDEKESGECGTGVKDQAGVRENEQESVRAGIPVAGIRAGFDDGDHGRLDTGEERCLKIEESGLDDVSARGMYLNPLRTT